jgi:hypothetical protein
MGNEYAARCLPQFSVFEKVVDQNVALALYEKGFVSGAAGDDSSAREMVVGPRNASPFETSLKGSNYSFVGVERLPYCALTE